MGGIETRRTGKSEGTSVTRKVGLLVVESYKVKGKLLTTSRTM
jgi:molybdenum-dependent DNA-binding transcriptional regulator ModE